MNGSTVLLLLLACLWDPTWGTVLPFGLGAWRSPAGSSISPQPCSSLLQVATQVFEEKDWNFAVQEHLCQQDVSVITCWLEGYNGGYGLIAILDDSKQQVIVYIKSVYRVPKNHRAKASEYLTRVNYGLIIGNFEMDYRDGEVMYKGSMDVSGGKLEPLMFHNLIGYTTTTMDRYHAGLVDVIYSDKSPSQIIDEVKSECGIEDDV